MDKSSYAVLQDLVNASAIYATLQSGAAIGRGVPLLIRLLGEIEALVHTGQLRPASVPFSLDILFTDRIGWRSAERLAAFGTLCRESADTSEFQRVFRTYAIPVQPVHETLRRLSVAKSLSDELSHSASVILTGSLSYGRFLEVHESSDIDLLVTYDEDSFEPVALFAALIRAQIRPRSIAKLTDRFRHFCHFLADGRADIFVHKLEHVGSFPISLTLMPKRSLSTLIDLWELNECSSLCLNRHQEMVAYIEGSIGTAPQFTRDFFGNAEPQLNREEEVSVGFLLSTINFRMVEGFFHPGGFFNLLLPRFEVLSDNSGIGPMVEKARRCVWAYERVLRQTLSGASMMKSHARNARFCEYLSDFLEHKGIPVE